MRLASQRLPRRLPRRLRHLWIKRWELCHCDAILLICLERPLGHQLLGGLSAPLAHIRKQFET